MNRSFIAVEAGKLIGSATNQTNGKFALVEKVCDDRAFDTEGLVVGR